MRPKPLESAVPDGKALIEHEDRFFDPDPATRRAARDIYESTRDLPLLCTHGHVDPAILANNAPFPEPTALLVSPDHYIHRMLYSQGVAMESIGIPTLDGTPVESDPRRAWQVFGDNYYLFRGTPTGAWLDYELYDLFGIRRKLDGESAALIYDQILESLSSPEFRPRALFERFNIEALATTDKATDSLEHHLAIRNSDWEATVNPTFRPDAVFQIARRGWSEEIARLGQACGEEVDSYRDLIHALENRRAFFKTMGATSTDHAVLQPHTERISDSEADLIFQRGLSGKSNAEDQRRFEAHMLMESARMSTKDGLVMQIHSGSLRDHDAAVHARFGPDKGGDIPIATEYTRNLHAVLNAYGHHPDFTLVLFTLDESTYSRELAPLAGHYPAVRLGPPWWFHDSIEGMTRFRHLVTETAGIYNTAGFNDDTRAFCSIPARHDLSRRVDANWLGGLVARHIVDLPDAREMARSLAYDLARKTYKLKEPARKVTPPEQPEAVTVTR